MAVKLGVCFLRLLFASHSQPRSGRRYVSPGHSVRVSTSNSGARGADIHGFVGRGVRIDTNRRVTETENEPRFVSVSVTRRVMDTAFLDRCKIGTNPGRRQTLVPRDALPRADIAPPTSGLRRRVHFL